MTRASDLPLHNPVEELALGRRQIVVESALDLDRRHAPERHRANALVRLLEDVLAGYAVVALVGHLFVGQANSGTKPEKKSQSRLLEKVLPAQRGCLTLVRTPQPFPSQERSRYQPW